MRDRPTGKELLALAERIEAGDAAVAVPPPGRYRDLMLARARAIAERQATAGDGPERDEREFLKQILGRSGDLAALNRRLAAEIRQGRRDGDGAVLGHLWRTVIRRVRDSNPKALDGRDWPETG